MTRISITKGAACVYPENILHLVHMLRFVCRRFCIIMAAAFLIQAKAVAQTPLVRDTSFNITDTYLKENKTRPYIRIANPPASASISIVENLVYATGGNRKLQADIYYPSGDAGKTYPAVVMLFGGGWRSGDKSHNIPIAKQLAARGYVALSIEYRLSGEAKYPAAVEDVKAAIRWLRANAKTYHIDKNKIATLGMSAGAQLASLVGTTNGLKRLEGKGGNARESSEVQAIVNIDGLLAFHHPESQEGKSAADFLGGTFEEKPETWNDASALHHTDKNTPPIIFISSSFPRFQAGRDDMIAKLKTYGIYYEQYNMPDAPHPFWFFHPWFEPTVNYVTNFLDKVFKRTGESSLAQAPVRPKYDFVVAADGSGQFKTLQEAINAVPDFRKKETKIFIKNGVYKEKLVLAECKSLITLIGESIDSTIITYDDYNQKKNIFGEDKGTSGSAGFYIYGPDFSAENITFQNSAGPVGQAVAVLVAGDRARFRNCRFLGFQDTLYTYGRESRQYYNNCYIEGTVDFIFGSSTAVFDSCIVYGKRGGFYTAASTPEHKAFGYVFLNSAITGNAPPNSFVLGRPWRPFAKTVFINCLLDKQIAPEGWNNWSNPANEKTAWYAEYNNYGPGSSTAKRTSWSHILSSEEAGKYTLKNIFGDWDPLEQRDDNN